MDDKKIELIYEMIMDGLPLTDETLVNSGFSTKEIIELLEERIIIPTETGEYKLFSVVELYYYGIRLLLTTSMKKASTCFNKCYQLDKENRNFCLQLLLLALKRGDYQEAFEMFSVIEKIKSEEYVKDNNLYLYLLSILTKCPEEYAERLYSIDYDDILIPYDSEYYNKEQENAIRQSIMKNKYKYALRLLNDMIEQEPVYLINEALLKELILQAITAETKFETKILSFVEKQQYPLIISFLEHKMKKRYLSNDEVYVYLITKAIIELIETKSIPTPTVYSGTSIYEAIKGNNFKLALKIERRFIKFSKSAPKNNIVEALLIEINKRIYNLKISQQCANLLIKDSESQEHLSLSLQKRKI